MFKIFCISNDPARPDCCCNSISLYANVVHFKTLDDFLLSPGGGEFSFGIISCDLISDHCIASIKDLSRQSSFCIIGKSDDQECKELALELNAMDYLWEGMPAREMKLRLNHAFKATTHNAHSIQCANLKLNRFLQKAIIGDKNVELTRREFHIVNLLSHVYPNHLTKKELIDFLWEGAAVSSQSLNTHMLNLRKKLIDWECCIKFEKNHGYGISHKKN